MPAAPLQPPASIAKAGAITKAKFTSLPKLEEQVRDAAAVTALLPHRHWPTRSCARQRRPVASCFAFTTYMAVAQR